MYQAAGEDRLASKRTPSAGRTRRRASRTALATSGGQAAPRARPAPPRLELEALLPSFPALLFLVDGDGRILDYRGGEELYLPPRSFLGRRVEEVLPPAAGSKLAEAVTRARDGQPVLVDYSLPFPEGERHFEARLRALAGGRVTALCTDVTARRRAEEALRQSEERFRALIEYASDLLVVLDEQAAITMVSPAVKEGLGWDPEEMLGRRGREFIHPEDVPEALRCLQAVIAAPQRAVHTTIRLRHRDGGWRVVESTLRNLLHVPAVRGIVSNGRDITEQRQLEQRLLQALKLESVGRLAGGVAHDFNNLLVAILGYAQFLEEGIRAGKPSLEDLAEIREAGEQARDLTRQLLAVARRQVVEPVVMDLNGVLRDAERLLRRVLGEDVVLTVIPAPDLWRVKADPAQVQQVVLNLAVNARDAMPRGGTLVLETANVEIDDRYAQAHPGVRPGRYARLAVSDSGVGMSPEARAHLFEPFFTTKPAGEGTGLGLATVYGIVQQAGGHVSVHSETGRGTSFQIHLPRTEEAEAGPEPAAARRDIGGDETVLVVEDAPAVRELAVRALEEAGYRVLQARNGREALAAAGAPGPVHLVLTDVVMPDMSGPQLAQALGRNRPGTRVLYMSGYTENTVVHHGVIDAGVSFLAKPFTPTTLLEKVRQVLDAS
ncbi:MAG TPA: PAS domain S-box protein [Anaeromyxobacteraceae bacterium]|nr:PAS domain S-box protein [Anaeromyxobacteraceae bacterium]